MAAEQEFDTTMDKFPKKAAPKHQNFLAGVVDLWGREFFQQALDVKTKFNDEAAMAIRYYGGDHDFVFEEQEFANMAGRSKTTVNKIDDAVSLFGPALFFSRPRREVSALRGNEDFAKVLEKVLNYLANHHDLERNSKSSVTEGIIKGANGMWAEIHPVTKLPYSKHYSISDVFVDPDVTKFADAKWVMKRYVLPVWEVRRRWRKTARGIKGAFDKMSQRYSSVTQPVMTPVDQEMQMQHVLDENADRGSMAKYVWVYEFWSTMGLGQLTDTAQDSLAPDFKQSREVLKDLYKTDIKEKNLVITLSPDHPVPLDIKGWPVPFHKDASRFPVDILYYKERVDELWPKSLLQSAMALQQMMDWLASFMMSKARDGSKDYTFVVEQLKERLEDAIANAHDNSIIPVNMEGIQRNLNDLIFQVKGDGVNVGLINWFDKVSELFQEASGMTDVLQGFAGRDRETATSVQARVQSSNIRIDQMQKDVERWQSTMAKKEAILAYSTMEPETVKDIVGDMDLGFFVEIQELGEVLDTKQAELRFPELTGYFDTEAAAQDMVELSRRKIQEEQGDVVAMRFSVLPVDAAKVWEDNQANGIDFIINAFDYDIAVGSARRPDRFEKITLAQSNLQLVGPIAVGIQQFNVYNKLLKNVYSAQDIPEEEQVFLEIPQAPPQMQQGAPQDEQALIEQPQSPAPGLEGGLAGLGFGSLQGAAQEATEPRDVEPLPVAIQDGQPVFEG